MRSLQGGGLGGGVATFDVDEMQGIMYVAWGGGRRGGVVTFDVVWGGPGGGGGKG